MTKEKQIEQAYNIAKEQYSELGVNTDEVIKRLGEISVSLHCWQADDVGGFEQPDAELSGGGIQATGNFPGKAKTLDELFADLEKSLSMIPGNHRVNLHAIYGDFNNKFVDRDQIEPKHFQTWIDWAKKNDVKLDFNCTCFSHPKANDGFTLSSLDKGIRDFWIEHLKRCREVSAEMGRQLNSPAIHNIWLPDGAKDMTVNRFKHRQFLKESLDEVLAKEYPKNEMKDSIESKLFGIGSESFVAGSHEFYMGYAMTRNQMLCVDMGHFHPTESVADKISAIFQYSDELMLHVSRGVKWDSDHVVILKDETLELANEIVRAGLEKKINYGLDFFDASINRIGAYVVGTRAFQKCMLIAMLEPLNKIRKYEESGKLFERLALIEENKAMPWGAVYDYFCIKNGVTPGQDFINDVQDYEKNVLSKR